MLDTFLANGFSEENRRADNRFMQGALDRWDPAGGALALQESFVTVRKA